MALKGLYTSEGVGGGNLYFNAISYGGLSDPRSNPLPFYIPFLT